MTSPELFRSKVGEPHESFPVGAGRRETTIESAVEDEILFPGVRSGEECAYGIGTEQRLGEVPYLP